MSCPVCTSAHSRLPFLCSTCARNRLYQLRLEYTQILLEKEALGRRIESTVSSNTHRVRYSKAVAGSRDGDHGNSRRLALQAISSEESISASRVATLRQQSDILRHEIESKKREISERKERLARRRSDAESAQYQLGEREGAILTGIQNTAKRTEHLWHNLHGKTAEARIFLCREAAHLYGLRQKTAKTGDTRQTYVLGGLAILDLRDLNGKLILAYIH